MENQARDNALPAIITILRTLTGVPPMLIALLGIGAFLWFLINKYFTLLTPNSFEEFKQTVSGLIFIFIILLLYVLIQLKKQPNPPEENEPESLNDTAYTHVKFLIDRGKFSEAKRAMKRYPTPKDDINYRRYLLEAFFHLAKYRNGTSATFGLKKILGFILQKSGILQYEILVAEMCFNDARAAIVTFEKNNASLVVVVHEIDQELLNIKTIKGPNPNIPKNNLNRRTRRPITEMFKKSK